MDDTYVRALKLGYEMFVSVFFLFFFDHRILQGRKRENLKLHTYQIVFRWCE